MLSVALPLFGFFALGAFAYKPFLLSFMPEVLRFQTVDVTRIPRLDRISLQHFTDEFLRLGFVWVGDITNTSGIKAFNDGSDAAGAPIPSVDTIQNAHELVPGFCRVFAHPQQGCLAEAYQHFPPQGQTSTPMNITVSSLLSDGWDITTSNRKPEAIPYVLRRPRGIRTTHPGSNPGELLNAHLSLRTKLQHERGTKLIPLSRLEDYVEQERRVVRESKEALRKRLGPVAFWEALTFHLQPKREWLGK
ncbi:MAG TPA: hypothetical protein VF681_14140 [Abditibacteriaceae bacterium]|jgi:hypothetical protein